MCVKWWTVKCGVLPVLATEQPPYYITQSSCLVEHIIRLCHQLQQNVCIRSTAVLCHAETLKWWRASCGRKYHEPEYYFHCPRAKKPPKTDLSTATALNDPICFPFPSFPAAAGLVLPVKTLRDLGTVGLRCKRHLILAIPKEQPGNSAAQPVSVWRCIFIVCVLCAFPLLLNPENTTDLNPYVKEISLHRKIFYKWNWTRH